MADETPPNHLRTREQMPHAPAGLPRRSNVHLSRAIDARVSPPPSVVRDVAITFGNFDGVHRGHQSLVARARVEAEERGIVCAVVTFDPHPRQVLRPDSPVQLIATVEERVTWLADAGADQVIIWPFDDATRAQSPREFLNGVGQYARVRAVIHGPGFALGRARVGTPHVLASIGSDLGFEVIAIDPHSSDHGVVSSSEIREAIGRGDIDRAARDLGRWPTYMGTVVPGNRVGRTIGFPTANLEPKVVLRTPGDGVYAAWVERWPLSDGARFYPAAVSVGDRPTFAGTARLVEAHLIDFDDDLYGETLRLHIVARVRGQERFASVDALIVQMHQDVEGCREILRALAQGSPSN
jgi:riboflavin kinase/FMN adenylyltransferase